MNRTRSILVMLAIGVLSFTPSAFASDYSLANGMVKFSAPDGWPMLMEKLHGSRQFVALHVKNPSNKRALARITVTVEHVNGVQGFQQFLRTNTKRAHKLPGYAARSVAGSMSSLHYTATENHVQNAYTETYAYRDNLGIQVRCIRPDAASGDWRATFDAGCKAIVTAVEK